MKRYPFLIILTILVSCVPFDKDGTRDVSDKNDSINIYYTRSISKDVSLEEKRESIDRALFLAKDLEADSILGKLMYKKSSLLFQAGDYNSLVAHHDSFVTMQSEVDRPRLKASQYYLMGYYYDRIQSDYSRAFENYSAAKSQFELAKDSSWTGNCLLLMGVIQKNQNDFFGSKETVTEALQFLRESRDIKKMVQYYGLLATNHRKLLNFEDAIFYYTKAIKNSGSLEDRIAFENNLAATYIDNGRYEEAIALLDKIVGNTALDSTPVVYARILDNLSYAQWLLEKKDVGASFQKALQIRKEKKDWRGQLASYTHLGEFHLEDRSNRAKAYFDTVIQVAKKIEVPRAEIDALKFLMQIDPENVKLRDRYILLADSLDSQELKVKTQFAKYKYDDKIKQESILRLEKEKAEQALLTAKERNQKTISYLGSLTMLLGLGFAIYFFKQRTRHLKEQNRLTRLEATLETEAEMSRRLHDDFGAGLNQTMLMINADVDRTAVLDKLDGLYNQSRNFSREVNEVAIGTHFKEAFLEMLRFRTPSDANLFMTGVKDVQWNEMAPLSQKVLFKAIQELMINMGKHSSADMITIVFKSTEKVLTVNYSDNGVGASLKELNAKNGLWNTEKRIQAIGGSITFDSHKGQGFKAHITIPL
ncbi:hypothetical protein [Flagellimonas halotolerans]|uniref:histidine kinase n=1 Tax=Flagellimonas halotolerans TaxID=3112164 RepID=A0ABU6IP64_9FLAO|nr:MULTISPECIES: hypothetical protein [unclassified Allomuricauda]MEC3965256.1 hypothetical protein [Muricauda sp. SYSU M86414]MEC4264899.1 hypothetical protein [Muricauda sp. SYSU M84420]